MQECIDISTERRSCPFKLKYYDDYLYKGVSQPWQITAGFMGPAKQTASIELEIDYEN